ncbi:MAG: TerD family protein [Jatrophihabitans sp.]|uniref:TerD family protein n=1 Tax=Jatrophihabitans sp. TaxID=1932789 RepID=UPI003F814710
MPIDYTKRPRTPQPEPEPQPPAQGYPPPPPPPPPGQGYPPPPPPPPGQGYPPPPPPPPPGQGYPPPPPPGGPGYPPPPAPAGYGYPPPPPPPGYAPAAPPPPPAAPAPAAPQAAPVSLSKVTLTKAAPRVSLEKHAGGGLLRVNLNWNARPAAGGLFRKTQQLDLDLGCLYEFADGSKGVVQALGNSFEASPRGVSRRVIWLDKDDRSGANTEGENLFIDLAYADQVKRVLVFAFIYEGAANWADARGVVTLFPAQGPQIEIHLDDPRDGARTCAIAMLQGGGGTLSVDRQVNYINGGQRLLDQTYGWGMNWTPGRK